MKIEMVKDKTQSVTKILLAVAVLLGALVFLKIAGFFVSSAKAKMIAVQTDPNGAGGGDLSKLLAETKASAEQLKKKNLFVLTPPKQHPVTDVLGILGNEALIGDKWYKVGDSVADAKIVAIGPTKVRIAWDGQEKEFSPISAGGSGGPGGRPGPQRPSASGRPGPGGSAKMVVTGSRGGAVRGGQGLSAEEREQIRQRWSSMSNDERQRYRDE